MVYSYFLIQKMRTKYEKTDMLREAYLITVIEIHIIFSNNTRTSKIVTFQLE